MATISTIPAVANRPQRSVYFWKRYGFENSITANATPTQYSTLESSLRLPNSGSWFMSRERGSNGSVWDEAVVSLLDAGRQLSAGADNLRAYDIPPRNEKAWAVSCLSGCEFKIT